MGRFTGDCRWLFDSSPLPDWQARPESLAKSALSIAVMFPCTSFFLRVLVPFGSCLSKNHRDGRHLEMSDALLGATLLALGGSITDFMTGLVSAFKLHMAERERES